tara:strand:+ start:9822 stop:11153 length:1332 start_codon:yes stop_codon:yes gene_type:complete
MTASMVNVALPTMATDFNVDLPTAQWIALGFFAAVASLHLSVGRLADIFGRGRLFNSGFLLFGLASLAAGLSPSVEWLIALRIVQAIGLSILQANAFSLLMAVFPEEQRGRAMGYFASIASVGLAIGPLAGGIILHYASWKWMFFCLSPISLCTFVIGVCTIQAIGPGTKQRFDIVSAATMLFWIFPLVFGINRGFILGWTSSITLSSMALSMFFLFVFIRRQQTTNNPLVDPTLFRSFNFLTGILTSYLGFVSLSSVTLLAPFLFQNGLKMPIAQVGLFFSILSVVAAITAILAGRAVDRWGSAKPRTAGLLLMCAGYTSMAFVNPSTGIFLALVSLALTGMGVGFWEAPAINTIMSSIPSDKLGLGGGFVAGSRTLGWATGQPIFGGIFALVVMNLGSEVALSAPQGDQLSGFQITFLFAAIMALLISIFSGISIFRKSAL